MLEVLMGPSMVVIRQLGEEDIEGICALWKEFAELREGITEGSILNEDAEDYFFGYATGLLHKKDMLTQVAEIDGEIVAYMIVGKQRKPPIYKHTRIAYLSDAYVQEAHRGKGILRQFIDALKVWARENGLTAIDVMLFSNNADAQAIYAHFGFQPYRVVQRMEMELEA